MKTNILIADDNANMRCVLRSNLERLGHAVFEAGDGREAAGVLEKRQIDIVISDLKMPNMDGHELLGLVRRDYPDVRSIMITAHGTVKDAVQAMKLGAVDFITKPFEFSEIERIVRKAENLVDQDQEPKWAAGTGMQSLIGESEKMAGVRRLIAQVAAADSTVLILGESGTGKELAARAIHDLSARKNQPFVAVNCAALGAGVLESELFGHEKGAFTGAISTRAGRFELADKSTLFLDEIGEINMDIQVKLLRVLQEKRFERVGGVKAIRSDFRLIAATNKKIEEEISSGRFRQDLYYRLNIFPIILPPLRERREDISILTKHFISIFNNKLKKKIKGMSREVFDAFGQYSWPGNIRELENIIERSMVLCKSDEITPADLPPNIRHDTRAAAGSQAEDAPGGLKDALKTSIASIEKEYIIAALGQEESNRTNAAKRLGISRKSLQLKIKEYGLENY